MTNSTRMSADERGELRQTARRILAERSPIARVRELLDDPVGYDPGLHAELIELGWSGMHLPEAIGGYGASFVDTSPVVTELGRALTGGPLVSSSLIAASAFALSPNAALAASTVPSLVDGSRTATVAVAGASGHYSAAALGPCWRSAGAGVVVDGDARFVLDAAAADTFVVFAGGDDGVIVMLVDRSQPGVSVEPVATIDQTRRSATVRFDGVAVADSMLLAEPADGARLLADVVDVGAAAVALDSFGVAEVVVERTAEYVKQRFQFGRSIGSFQAIKHRLADAVLLVETSRVAIDNAAAAIALTDRSMSPRDRVIAVATAKAYAGDAAVKICGDSLQSHGGIGFTWEHDTHLYLKRAMLNQAVFGTSSWHRRRVADQVLPSRHA